MRLFLAFVLALLSMSSTTALARPVEGVPCARAGAWHARDEMQGHNGVLLYAQQRWLDPSTGRFLSLDPFAGALDEPLSTQGYTYAHANPTRFTDPDGRCIVWNGGTHVGTDFDGCGKTAAGYLYGFARAAVGVVTGVGVLTYNLTGDLLYTTTGGEQYRAQAEATRAMVDGLASPIDTLSGLVNGVAGSLIDATDRGDYFAAGNTIGSTATNTVLVGAGAATVATGVRAIANLGDDIANSAIEGFAAGIAEVGGASTRPLTATSAGPIGAAPVLSRWSEGPQGADYSQASSTGHGGLGATSSTVQPSLGASTSTLTGEWRAAVQSSTVRPDPWRRTPTTLMDQMTLEAAQDGAGSMIIRNLNDPLFKGMEKWEYKVKSASGQDSVVHYVRNPENGDLMDFKFKKRQGDSIPDASKRTEPRVSSGDPPAWWESGVKRDAQ